MKKIEILSPAGSLDSVHAAANAGADAVYLGAKQFSARSSAHNFDEVELKDAIEFCHNHKMKVYLTLNTIYFDSEKKELVEVVKMAVKLGIDAFIVQDLGLFNIIKNSCKNVEIHGSTQMAVHSLQGAIYLKNIGFDRVVLARELSLEQIENIAKNSGIDTEVFVHGAMCMSVSGNCYASSLIGGRSGNRGKCAQTCRLPFSTDGLDPNRYDLSLKDMSNIEHIQKLEEIGVTSVKIEGRMKRSEYVSAATDGVFKTLQGEEYDQERLESVFSRTGFSDGYLVKEYSDMFGIRRKEDVVRAKDALKSIENEFRKEKPRVELDFKFTLSLDGGAKLSTTYDGKEYSAETKEVEPFNSKPTSDENIEKNIRKVGGTIFSVNEIICENDLKTVIPLSQVNAMRREILEQIQASFITEDKKEFKENNVIYENKAKNNIGFRARFNKFSQIPENAIKHLDKIILPIKECVENIDALDSFKSKLIVELPYTLFDREENISEQMEILKEHNVFVFQANNLAHIQMVKNLELEFVVGTRMNVVNSDAIDFFAHQGAKAIDLSVEVDIQSAKNVKSPVDTGVFVYGYIPVMTTRVCPVKNKIGCKTCGKGSYLTDRLGNDFFVTCDEEATFIYNPKPVYLPDRIEEMNRISYGVLYFTREEQKQCESVLKDYLFKKKTLEKDQYTRGLLYRKIQ